MPIDGEPVAGLHAVTHVWDDGRVALSDVTLPLPPRGLCGLVGANGAGKSTVLRLFAGTLVPTRGRVKFSAADRAGKRWRERVSLVSQQRALDPEMTGRETLTFFARLEGLGASELRERVATLTGSMGLQEVENKRVGAWSGGEQQRLHLAVGGLREPELLLLDEPCAGLDTSGRDFVWRNLRERSHSASVMVATHLIDNVARHCSDVVVLRSGRVVARGTPEELTRAAGLGVTLTLREPIEPGLLSTLCAESWVEGAWCNKTRLDVVYAAEESLWEPSSSRQDKVSGWLRQRGVTIGSYKERTPDLAVALSPWLKSGRQEELASGGGGRTGGRRGQSRSRGGAGKYQ